MENIILYSFIIVITILLIISVRVIMESISIKRKIKEKSGMINKEKQSKKNDK